MSITESARRDDRDGASSAPPGTITDPEKFFEPWNPTEPPRTPWQRYLEALVAGDFEAAHRALAQLFMPNVPIGFVVMPDGTIRLFDATGLMPDDTPLGPPFPPGVLDAMGD